MIQYREAKASIDTQVATLQGIAAAMCPLEVLVTDIDSPLWPSEEEYVGRTAQAYSVTEVDRNGNLLLLYGLFLTSDIGNFGRTIVVKG